MELFLDKIDSPLGEMLLLTDSQGLVRALDFANHNVRLQSELRERFSDIELREAVNTEAVRVISRRLDRYFSGDLTALDDIAVAADGTDFQRQVWAALRKIPAGKTTPMGNSRDPSAMLIRVWRRTSGRQSGLIRLRSSFPAIA